MDCDPTVDCELLKIKNHLNQTKVKLWLTPYYSEKEGINESEMKDLAESVSSQLSIPMEVCLDGLHKLQKRALDNLKEQTNYKTTGIASLKVRVPSEKGTGRIVTVGIELTKTGFDLKCALSTEISIGIERLKLIFRGKIIKDEETLEYQGVRHGVHIMAIILGDESNDLTKHESNLRLLDSMKEDVKLLARGHMNYDLLQVADQSGKCLNLPEHEKTALLLAMTLHEKGRAAIKKEDFALALVLLLEAEKEFSYCNSSLLKSVDNYGLLNLDIVWCYLNLQSVTQLPDAEQRLSQCESTFHQSYGANLERLIALKGSAENENALFLRLHLLQAIVLYHQNKFEQAKELFDKVEEQLKSLEVDDTQVSQLVELGYTPVEARLALRQTNGNVDAAVDVIETKREEKKKNEEEEKKERKLKKEKKKLGKCVNGEWIDPEFHKTLMSMGYSYEIAKWALAQTCNSVSNGVNLIQEHPEFIPGHCLHATDDAVAQVSSLGFDKKMSKLALKKHKGDIEKAIEELVATGGTVLDFMFNDSSSSSDDFPSSSSVVKKAEAYERVAEGLSNYEEDHLDLNLAAEKAFLEKYKDLLTKWL